MKFVKHLSLTVLAAIFANSAIAEPVDAAARFAKLDRDSDGKVTLDELKAGMKKKPEAADKILKAKDKDSDGSLSTEEFTAKPEKKN